MGSQNGGLINYKVKENKFIAYLPENSNISKNRVTAVRTDSKGQIYLAATNKLQIFNPAENKFISYDSNPNDSNSLSDNYIIDILIQNDTTVWVGCGYGLNKFNPVSKKFIRYFMKDGLPNNLINGITLDKSGALWISTGNGICRFDYSNNTFKNFSKSDGLQSNEFTDRSILTLKSGQIMAGGINGFNIITPSKLPENKKKYQM